MVIKPIQLGKNGQKLTFAPVFKEVSQPVWFGLPSRAESAYSLLINFDALSAPVSNNIS